MEQLGGMMRALATNVLAPHFHTMLDEGLERDEALALTIELQRAFTWDCDCDRDPDAWDD